MAEPTAGRAGPGESGTMVYQSGMAGHTSENQDTPAKIGTFDRYVLMGPKELNPRHMYVVQPSGDTTLRLCEVLVSLLL